MPVLFAILLIVVLVIIGPFLTIWSLNTLFPLLNIPFNIQTWFAVIILGMALRGNVTVNK